MLDDPLSLNRFWWIHTTQWWHDFLSPSHLDAQLDPPSINQYLFLIPGDPFRLSGPCIFLDWCLFNMTSFFELRSFTEKWGWQRSWPIVRFGATQMVVAQLGDGSPLTFKRQTRLHSRKFWGWVSTEESKAWMPRADFSSKVEKHIGPCCHELSLKNFKEVESSTFPSQALLKNESPLEIQQLLNTKYVMLAGCFFLSRACVCCSMETTKANICSNLYCSCEFFLVPLVSKFLFQIWCNILQPVGLSIEKY